MNLYRTATDAVERAIVRALSRAALVFGAVAASVIALYHATVAGLFALESSYGFLHARLIVALAYAVAALICIVVSMSLRRRTSPNAVEKSREYQVAILLEAAMLGYSMARKGGRENG
jgi:hypothetical protein